MAETSIKTGSPLVPKRVAGMARRSKQSKFESCVRQNKGKPGINPFAVCRAAVFGKSKGGSSHGSHSDLGARGGEMGEA